MMGVGGGAGMITDAGNPARFNKTIRGENQYNMLANPKNVKEGD